MKPELKKSLSIAGGILMVSTLTWAYLMGPPAANAPIANEDRILWLNPETGSIEAGVSGSWGEPTLDPIPPPNFGSPGVPEPCKLANRGELDLHGLWRCRCAAAASSCYAEYAGHPPLEKCSRAYVVRYGRVRQGFSCVRGRHGVADPDGRRGWHFRAERR